MAKPGTKARAKPRTKPATRPKSAARPVARKKSPAPHARPAARAKRPPSPQIFRVSHFRDEDFQIDGLRAYAKYRDLGIAKATNGMVQAHVIRFMPPFRAEEVSKLHYHDVEFQMIYVLKGWIKTELEGQGGIVMRAGSCWIQPPRIKHTVLGYSDDCEVLEIILPAEFETVELSA